MKVLTLSSHHQNIVRPGSSIWGNIGVRACRQKRNPYPNSWTAKDSANSVCDIFFFFVFLDLTNIMCYTQCIYAYHFELQYNLVQWLKLWIKQKITQRYCLMHSTSSHSRSSKPTDNVALEKISSFITRFYAVLLPKANDEGAYRDLSEEEQYLLANLDNDNPLHSILAGCLAIDSCLSNITQAEQNLTDNILKSLTSLCAACQKTQKQLVEGVQNKNLTVMKVEQAYKKIEESTRNLIVHCHGLPFSQQNQQIKKQQKIMSQQDITFKISSLKLFEDQDAESKENAKELQIENARLQEQLTFTEKKVIQLEMKINKMHQNTRGSQRNDEISRQKNIRKYSQTGKQSDMNNWPHFATPSSTNTNQEREIQSLKEQITAYEKTIFHTKQQFKAERKKMIRQIRALQQQLRQVDQHQDKELIQLLQELEDEIESLRQERRHDERIIGQIQKKLQAMNISKQSRITQGVRGRQSRANLKYSGIYLADDISDIQSRSPSFKKSRIRERNYTSNGELSRSSISMPKIPQYNEQERHRFKWKAERVGPIRDNYKYAYEGEGNEMRYSRDLVRQSGLYRHSNPQDYESKPEISQKKRIKSIYSVPLVESKLGKQSFMRPQDKNLPQNQRKIQQGKYESRKQTQQEQNREKASKWHQITNTNHANKQVDPRLKTSRI